MAVQRAPFPRDPEEFGADSRISFSKETDNYVLEDETGEEWEWLSNLSKWVPAMDEALAEQQRATYVKPGEEEDQQVNPSTKRKAALQEHENAKKQKAEAPKERVNTAIYVTNLPDDVDLEEMHECFSRYGVIAESIDDDSPRIKMYTNDKGDFNGDALIVYFRPESVAMACNMLDDTDFRLGKRDAKGTIKVVAADANYKVQKEEDPAHKEAVKKKGTASNRDRQKAISKREEMNRRLADWDEDDVSIMPATSNRWDKVVILKHMFTSKELEEDADLAEDIVEDTKEECSKFGPVENVVLFDAETDGVMTVRFANSTASRACVAKMDGRKYEGRTLSAKLADGTERFQKHQKEG